MASHDSGNDYDALGTKMSSSHVANLESGNAPVAVVVTSSRGAKAKGTQVVVWTVVGVILVLAIVAIVVLATRQTNSSDDDGSDDDKHTKQKIHHLKHEVHTLGSKLHTSQQNLTKTKNALALADEGLAICHAKCDGPSPSPSPGGQIPWGPGPVIPSGGHGGNQPHPIGPIIPVIPTPNNKPVIPWGPGPVIPTPHPHHHHPQPTPVNLVNPNLQPPRTFAFNLAQIPSGNYQTYCPDTPSGHASHATPTHYVPPKAGGMAGNIAGVANGIKDLEPFVDTLGDHGLVTQQPSRPSQPMVMPSRPSQPMVVTSQRAGTASGASVAASPFQIANSPPPAQQVVNQPPGQSSQAPSISHKTGEEVVAYLKMKPKGVIVAKFDSCGFCKKLMKETLPNLKTAHPVTVVDASEMSKLPKNMQVSGFPTIFLVDGDIKKTQPGYMPAEKLDALIEEILG